MNDVFTGNAHGFRAVINHASEGLSVGPQIVQHTAVHGAVAEAAGCPVVDVRGECHDIAEEIAVFVRSADGDGSDDMIVRVIVPLNKDRISLENAGCVIRSITVIRRCSIGAVSLKQAEHQNNGEQYAYHTSFLYDMHFTFPLFSRPGSPDQNNTSKQYRNIYLNRQCRIHSPAFPPVLVGMGRPRSVGISKTRLPTTMNRFPSPQVESTIMWSSSVGSGDAM